MKITIDRLNGIIDYIIELEPCDCEWLVEVLKTYPAEAERIEVYFKKAGKRKLIPVMNDELGDILYLFEREEIEELCKGEK